jgi:hypothetical protein
MPEPVLSRKLGYVIVRESGDGVSGARPIDVHAESITADEGFPPLDCRT